jgi:hypothetical protein
MTMANRRTRDPRGDPTQLIIDLDLDEIERKKAHRLYRLNVVQIPALRLLGFCLLTICIFFHNLFILKSSAHPNIFEIASIVIGYSIISWLILYSCFGKIKRFDIGFLFLVFDIFMWTLMVYFSGGEKSLLFWLMVIRVADQINTSFKRVLFGGIFQCSVILEC